MGGCHTSDNSLIDSSDSSNLLISRNLALIESICMFYIDKKNTAVALKVKKIYEETFKQYYRIKKCREIALQQEAGFSSSVHFKLEKEITKEESQLKTANEALSRIFQDLQGSWFSPSKNTVNSFIWKAKARNQKDIERIDRIYYESLSNNQSIDYIVQKYNHGNDITHQEDSLVVSICRVTTYLFNSKDAVSYPAKAKRKIRHKVSKSMDFMPSTI